MKAKIKKENQTIRISYLFTLIFLSVFCARHATASDSPRFFNSIPDVPVMSGIEELSEHTFMFDKPAGRIVETVAIIKGTTPEEINDYYIGVLPQFGWKKVGEYTFVRKQERLQISYKEYEGIELFRIMIIPR